MDPNMKLMASKVQWEISILGFKSSAAFHLAACCRLKLPFGKTDLPALNNAIC